MDPIWQIFPKKGILFVYLYAFSMTFIVFDLEWYHFFIIGLIDFLTFMMVLPLFEFGFIKFFSNYKPLKVENFVDFYKDKKNDQQNIYDLISSFPLHRSFYTLIVSVIKVLPVGLYINHFSPLKMTFMEKMVLFYVLDIFVIIFCSGHLFIQLHEMCSSYMDQLMVKDSWKENYFELRPQSKKDDFVSFQNFVFLSMVGFLLLGTFVIAKIEGIHLLELIIFYSTAFVCLATLQFHFKNYFLSSFYKTLKFLDFDLNKSQIPTLGLQTFNLVAGFQYAINQLGRKIELREKEIKHWLQFEANQFHFRSMGEVTALVAHDIKTPLSVMRMSLDEMRDPSTTNDDKKRYEMIIDKNLNQAISFTKSLMAYFRGGSNNEKYFLSQIHLGLIDILKTQFKKDDFDKIKIEIDDKTLELQLIQTQIDLMHVFYNLYQNAIKSLILSNSANPELKIYSELTETGKVYVYVKDNGLGLSQTRYEQIISFDRFSESQSFVAGLGLRLTKTILEKNNGNLGYVSMSEGACFKVELPCNVPEVSHTESVQFLN